MTAKEETLSNADYEIFKNVLQKLPKLFEVNMFFSWQIGNSDLFRKLQKEIRNKATARKVSH